MKIAFLWLVAFFPAFAFAGIENNAHHCTPTPTMASRYPGQQAIVPSNKLALPAGKSAYAKGQLIYLSGRVLDENCVPVSDAIIDIWQADPRGKMITSHLADRVSPEPHFTGSGRAVTDNLGRYNFVTLFPAIYKQGPPHIHFRIVRPGFPTLNTTMFFAGDNRNNKDKSLSRHSSAALMGTITETDAGEDGESLAVEWDITLKGKNPYRHF